MNFDDLIQDEDLEVKDNSVEDDKQEDNPTIETTEIEPTTDESEKDESNDVDDATDDNTDEDVSGYFEVLKSMKVLNLPEDFKFTGKMEDLEQALEVTKQSNIAAAEKELWESLPESFRVLLDYGRKGGKDINAFLSTFNSPDYEEVSLETPEDQKKILFDYYKTTSKHSDERIIKMINSLEVSGDLEESAKEAKEDLVSFYSERKQNFLAEQEAQMELQRKQFEDYKNQVTSGIDNLKVDQLRKNRLKQVLYNPIKVGDRVTTEFDSNLDAALDNPEHLIQLAEIFADYNPKIGFNFDRIKKQLKSESTLSFKQIVNEKLDSSKSKIGGSSTKQTTDESALWKQHFNY